MVVDCFSNAVFPKTSAERFLEKPLRLVGMTMATLVLAWKKFEDREILYGYLREDAPVCLTMKMPCISDDSIQLQPGKTVAFAWKRHWNCLVEVVVEPVSVVDAYTYGFPASPCAIPILEDEVIEINCDRGIWERVYDDGIKEPIHGGRWGTLEEEILRTAHNQEEVICL